MLVPVQRHSESPSHRHTIGLSLPDPCASIHCLYHHKRSSLARFSNWSDFLDERNGLNQPRCPRRPPQTNRRRSSVISIINPSSKPVPEKPATDDVTTCKDRGSSQANRPHQVLLTRFCCRKIVAVWKCGTPSALEVLQSWPFMFRSFLSIVQKQGISQK
jgi:hypothetical protein